MTALSPLSVVLDAAEREGRLNVHAADLSAALPGVSPGALRQALYRQQARGRLVRLSRGSGHWLIVPLQYALAGGPPWRPGWTAICRRPSIPLTTLVY